jgi:hypothetical protein
MKGAITCRPVGNKRSGWEAHHKQTSSALLNRACHGGRGGCKEELAEVHLVHRDIVL